MVVDIIGEFRAGRGGGFGCSCGEGGSGGGRFDRGGGGRLALALLLGHGLARDHQVGVTHALQPVVAKHGHVARHGGARGGRGLVHAPHRHHDTCHRARGATTLDL